MTIAIEDWLGKKVIVKANLKKGGVVVGCRQILNSLCILYESKSDHISYESYMRFYAKNHYLNNFNLVPRNRSFTFNYLNPEHLFCLGPASGLTHR